MSKSGEKALKRQAKTEERQAIVSYLEGLKTQECFQARFIFQVLDRLINDITTEQHNGQDIKVNQ